MKEKIAKIEKKKILIISGFLLLIIIILFGGAFIYNKFFYKRSYQEIETIMENAAKSYFQTNQDKLPQNINESISLSDTTLTTAEKMKSLAEYLKDETTTCTGSVTVTNINGNYRYTPYLDCDTKYQTQKFINYIQSNTPIVTEGNGLYQLNNELVYRGDTVNNYLKFSGKTYRIIKFTNEETVIILTEKLESMNWDDRYNVEKNSNMGINDYPVSRIKEYLDKLYQGTSLITEENKLTVVAHNLEIGKRIGAETDKTGTPEKSTLLENQYIGLLPLYDYLNASLDTNCTTSISASCMNYNYLAKFNYNWWTMTATSLNTFRVYRIDQKAVLNSTSGSGYVRPVLHLTKDAIYISGNGTKDNPYIIK